MIRMAGLAPALFAALPAQAHITDRMHAHPHAMETAPVLLGLACIALAGGALLVRARRA